MAHADSYSTSQLPEAVMIDDLADALELQRPTTTTSAAAAAADRSSLKGTQIRGSPSSAECAAQIGRNRANLLSELRSLSHQRLLTVDAAAKKATSEADSMRGKRRRHDSDSTAAAAAAETSPMDDDDDAAAVRALEEESVVDILDDDDDSDVVTVVTISTPISTPLSHSPAPSRRTPPTTTTTTTTITRSPPTTSRTHTRRASTVATAVAEAAARTSVTVVVPAMSAEDEADLQSLRSQGLVTAALRERTALNASTPASHGRDSELLQSLRATRRVTGLLGEQSFVRTLEATLQNRPQSGAMRAPVRRRPASMVVQGSVLEGRDRESEQGEVDGGSSIQNEIVLLSRARPVTRMLQSEQRQVLEILIRHRIERQQGRAPIRSNPAGVLLRQAHRMREQPVEHQQQQQQQQQHHQQHEHDDHGHHQAAAPANAITISVLQAQIRIMTEQMAEMARMVTATYQLQQDMQRTMNQQVAAVFHTFQMQAEYTQAQASAIPTTTTTATTPLSAHAVPMHASMPVSLQHGHTFARPAPTTVSAAAAAAAGGEEGAGGVTIGGCVICTQQVDSVLYRCGHMCVCGTCARQLKAQDQWCPMCRAPIEDIVKVYLN